jgi:hypothetical protein
MEIVKQLNETRPDCLTPEGEHLLDSAWVLWSHPWDSKKWDLKDYIKHVTIRTVEQFWEVYNGLPSLNNRDMWFLMREGVPPRWEDDINREGGSFKFRISGADLDNAWLTLSLYLVSENICRNPDDARLICGITVSPKHNGFSTVSVWNLDKHSTAHAIFPSNITGINFNMSMYQPHHDRHRG